MWSQNNQLIADALDYSLAAADYEIATPLLVEHGLQFFFQNKLTTLRRWLDAFSLDYMTTQPMLSVYYGWVLLNQGHLDQVEPYLQTAENGSQGAPLVRSITAIIRSSIAREREDVETVHVEANLALELASPDNLLARCAALAQLGAVQMMAGELIVATETLLEAVDSAQKSENLNVRFLSGGFLGIVYLLQNRPELAETILTETEALASELGLLESPLLSYVHLGLSQLSFIKRDFDQAKVKAQEAIAHYKLSNELAGLRWGALQLANIELTLGHFQAAEDAFELAYQTAQTLSNPHISEQMNRLKDGMAQRNLGEGLGWIISRVPASPEIASPRSSVPNTDLGAAKEMLEPLGDREKEILTLIGAGLKNKEIAAELFISINTVHYHTKNIYSKLDVNTRTQAIIKARELNLL